MSDFSDYETIKLTASNLASNDIIGTKEEESYETMISDLKSYSKKHSNFLDDAGHESLKASIKTANQDYSKLQKQANEVARIWENADNYTSDGQENSNGSNGANGSAGSNSNGSSGSNGGAGNSGSGGNDSDNKGNKGKNKIENGIATIGGISSSADLAKLVEEEKKKFQEETQKRLEQEELEKQRKEQEQQRLDEEEAERLRQEQQRLDQEEAERLRQEQQRLQQEELEKQRLDQETAAKKQQEAEQLQREQEEIESKRNQLENERRLQEEQRRREQEEIAKSLQNNGSKNSNSLLGVAATDIKGVNGIGEFDSSTKNKTDNSFGLNLDGSGNSTSSTGNGLNNTSENGMNGNSNGNLFAGNSIDKELAKVDLSKTKTLKSSLSVGLGLLAATAAGATTKKILDDKHEDDITLEDNVSLQGNLKIADDTKKEEFLDD